MIRSLADLSTENQGFWTKRGAIHQYIPPTRSAIQIGTRLADTQYNPSVKYQHVAPGSSINLAVSQLQETTRELDLSLLIQGASVEQKVGWDLLSRLLRQALEYRCDQITIEPEQSCWRTRFFAGDKNVEQIEYDVASLQQLANNLSARLKPLSNESGRLHSVLARVDKQRYLIIVTQLPGVDGVMFTLTMEPWQPMPSSFNELQLPSEIDRRIRHWLSAKGGWLAVAGPSSRLNVRGQLALLQAVSTP